MTTPANDEAALVAAVEAGWDTSFRLIFNFQAEGYNLPVTESDITESRAAFRELLTRQRDREARLLAFVERVGAYNPDDYYEDRLSGIVKGLANAAKTLLSELGGGESEDDDG